MSKHKEIKEDLNNCYKLINKLDAKCETRIDEQKERISDFNTDLKLLTQTVKSVADSLSTHVSDFQKHNDEEMKNYEIIQKNQVDVTQAISELKSSVDNEVALNQARDEKVEKMEKVQAKFLKWTAWVTGFIVIGGALYKLGIISIHMSGG